MMTWNLVRTLAVVAPIAILLLAGFALTLQSGFETGRESSRFAIWGKNLSHAVVFVSACVMGLVVIQQAIGFRPDSAW